MNQTTLHFNLFFVLMILAVQGQSQITVTAEHFYRPAVFTDSVIRSTAVTPPLPAEGPGQVWDYSDLQEDELIEIEYNDAAGHPDFPGATSFRADDLQFQGFPIPNYTYEMVDQNGWSDVGRSSGDVTYSITAFTGGPEDSLRFPTANLAFDGRIDMVKFPMNYEDQWSEERIEITPYEISIAAFGLQKTPGYRQRLLIQDRKVVGHGELTLPGFDGTPAPAIEVLLLKIVRTAYDSVFLGTDPAPPPLMDAFGLTQGGIAADSFYVFYTHHFGAPVMSIDFGADVAFYRPQAANTATAVKDLKLSATKAFPNPVEAGQKLTIHMEDPILDGHVNLVDPMGRLVKRMAFESGTGHQLRLEIPDAIVPGLYFYQIFEQDGRFTGVGKLQVN